MAENEDGRERDIISRDRELDIASRVSIRENDFRWASHDLQHQDLINTTKNSDITLANSLEVALNNHQRLHDEMRADRKLKDSDLADAVESSRDALANSLKVALDDHQRLHDQMRMDQREKENASNTSLKVALEDHHREHNVHDNAHQREHEATATALDKAEKAMDKRLEGMNEFRQQLNNQSSTFLTREVFDRFVKDTSEKTAIALTATSDKYDTVIKSIINRHDIDFEALRGSLQTEREIRKLFEGSVNTFKYLAGFFGVGGIASIIYLFINSSPK